ncbi:hypothetical protein GLOTRDRAFT_94326 [Gloeophyllum trabeum ATCC 11539]|uniref:F-box domain-containing protein n=1 Tax=Gloeophyllum trabeum (strain ATCC 11539 / FP-39264 / Madison 617) TaxID=670483 RepID=S7Q1P5_GLOTA|nr:uncharacterized protein GLOTRDRAFT_94326 [Gloeophyllum trabeum ATCC 11539]EPQ53901.1 hypothetical protein GLOTRDRAFT_94326 [Gloeophyllum trabeum ATCC 11539]
MPRLLDLNYDILATMMEYLETDDLLSTSLTVSSLRELSQDRLVCSVKLGTLDSIASFNKFILADSGRRLRLFKSLELLPEGWSIDSELDQRSLEMFLAPVLESADNLSRLDLALVDLQGTLDASPRLRDALLLTLRRVAQLRLSGKGMISLFGDALANGSACVRHLAVRLESVGQAGSVLFLLAPTRATLEYLWIYDTTPRQRLLFPDPVHVRWLRMHTLMLSGNPLLFDARHMQGAFPNIQELSMTGIVAPSPDPRWKDPGFEWGSLHTYSGHLKTLLSLRIRGQVRYLESASPTSLDHEFAYLGEPWIWEAATELRTLILWVIRPAHIDQLRDSLSRLCAALKVTKLSCLRLAVTCAQPENEVWQCLATCIRSSVLGGLSSLRTVEIRIGFRDTGRKGRVYRIRPPTGATVGRTNDIDMCRRDKNKGGGECLRYCNPQQ